MLYNKQTISKEPHNENASSKRRICKRLISQKYKWLKFLQTVLQTVGCAVSCLFFAFMFWTVDLFRSDMLYFLTCFSHVPVKESLLFSFNLLRQRHDISLLLSIVRSHALWRGRMSEFGPIRNHYQVHLVDHSTRVGCSTFCCATPCWREPTSSKQLSTVAAFCWFSVWSLSCRCRVKFM